MTDTNTNTRAPEAEAPEGERIAKVIARAGVASRRDAEAMIGQGRVTLNGAVLDSPAVNDTDADRIEVDGEPLPARERTRLWLFHKPRGLVTTARDPEGRPTVFESLPEDLPRVVAIGRLDINTEGLLLLTNDGGLAKVIAHPDTGWMRRYRVRAYGDITQADLDKLRGGITIDGMDYGPVEATLDRVQGDNLWITLGLREGKNREVKKILEHLGLAVNRLIRLSFGPFQLGDLEPGLVEEVRTKVLKEQLGQKLAGEAGVDFESPVREPIAPFGSEKRMAKGERAPKRDDRRERDDRGDRRERGGFGERPHRGGERDFSKGRDRDAGPRGGAPRSTPRGGAPRGDDRPRIAGRPERRPTVWRDDGSAEEKKPRKGPRRDEDPRAARAASAERPRERVGAIRAGEGRKVLVERLVADPRPERDERPPRRPREGARPAPGGGDRPRRPKPAGGSFGDRPQDGGFADRPPRRPRDEGFDRPRRDDAGPPRRPRNEGAPPRDRDERPRGGFRAGAGRDDRAGGGFRSGAGRGERPGGFRSGGAGRDDRPGGGFRTDGPRKGGGKGPGGFKGARPGGPKRDGAPGRSGPPGRGGPGRSGGPGGRPSGGGKGPPRRPRP